MVFDAGSSAEASAPLAVAPTNTIRTISSRRQAEANYNEAMSAPAMRGERNCESAGVIREKLCATHRGYQKLGKHEGSYGCFHREPEILQFSLKHRTHRTQHRFKPSFRPYEAVLSAFACAAHVLRARPPFQIPAPPMTAILQPAAGDCSCLRASPSAAVPHMKVPATGVTPSSPGQRGR